MPIPKTLQDAQSKVAEQKAVTGGETAFKRNHAFVEKHDHLQDGENWVGPRGDAVHWATKGKKDLDRQFVAVDAINEVLDRIGNALLQREADVDFSAVEPVEVDSDDKAEAAAQETAREAQLQRGAGVRELVASWWDRVKLWQKGRKVVKRSRAYGHGYFRLWLPAGQLKKNDDGTYSPPAGLDIAAALDLIQLSTPDPETCMVGVDPETQKPYAVFLYRRDERNRAEIWSVEGEKTILRDVGEGESEATEVEYELGGRLPIIKLEAELLITDPVRRQQNRINFFETILNRLGETAAFPERYLKNAQPHGVWLPTSPEDGPPLQVQQHGGRTFYLHPTPRILGSSTTTDLIGLPTEEREGARVKQSFMTPGVEIKEPTDPEYAIKAARHAKHTLLHNCKQGHIALESRGEASGLAYEQARADFLADLDNTRGPVEGALRDLFECLVAFAAFVSQAGNEWTNLLEEYRCVVNLHVKTGPITPEARQENTNQVDKGLLSRESAMAANGVEDVEAELRRIEAEPENQLSIIRKRAEIIRELKAAEPSLPLVQAAIAAGWTEEEAKKLFAAADEASAQDRQGRQEMLDALRRGARQGGDQESEEGIAA